MEFERDMLLGIGKWVKANAEAIYGTKPNPFPHSFEWGGDITAGENCLYGFVQRVPSSSKIEISGFSGVVSEVKLLASGQTCLFVQNGGRLEVDLSPPLHSEELFPVIKITFDDGFVVIPSPVAKGGAVLTSQNSMHLLGIRALTIIRVIKALSVMIGLFAPAGVLSHQILYLPKVRLDERLSWRSMVRGSR